jgi:hypothetical protein
VLGNSQKPLLEDPDEAPEAISRIRLDTIADQQAVIDL